MDYENLLTPLDILMRTITKLSRTHWHTTYCGNQRHGAMGYTNLLDTIHHEKYKMIQSAQEAGGLSPIAAQQMLMRLAESLNIPMTTQSPILIRYIDSTDIRLANNWRSRLDVMR